MTMNDGREDIRRAAEELAERLPDVLAPLARIAYNYRWSWLPGGPELFQAVDPARFALTLQNPVRLLQEASNAALRRAAADSSLLERAAAVEAQVKADLERPYYPSIDPARPVAFFCAEYGVHVSMPIYSGGLGALAGDLLKEASDCAVPLVAVGLMYRKGYFRQRIDAVGWQHEYWVDTDPQRLPAALVTGPDERPLTIEVPIYDADVTAQIWRVDVGRIPLFLLDTDLPENGPVQKWITARLYESDEHIRVAQYVLLGAGGVRALTALGFEPGVVHLNEGHAMLAPVQLAAQELHSGQDLSVGLASARERTVFTTHTPVPAGNDTYPTEQMEDAIGNLVAQLGIDSAEVIALGRTDPDDPDEDFGVTQAALHMSRAANGVSRRHGEVAREMWQPLWPKLAVDEVPIGYVTNGVHVPTWIGTPIRELLDRHLGEGWMARAAEPETWAAVDQISDADLWAARERQRADLVERVRVRSATERLLRGDPLDYVDAAATAFDPRTLTIGFARRVATYKRLDLLTRDPEWTLSLLGGDQPVQVVLAGKAHPRDEDAKRVLKRLFGMKRRGDHRPARGVPRRLRPGHRGVARARLRRVAERAAPAARGERHQRHEVGDQRGPPAERARRLVGRGLRRRQRLGDLRRGRRQSSGPGQARRGQAASPSRRGGATDVLRARRARVAGGLDRPDPGVAEDARAAVQRDADAVGVPVGPLPGILTGAGRY